MRTKTGLCLLIAVLTLPSLVAQGSDRSGRFWYWTPHIPEILVAANDAPQSVKDIADYVCDGTDDQVQIQNAFDALASTGGIVQLSQGTFTCNVNTDSESRIALTGKALDGSRRTVAVDDEDNWTVGEMVLLSGGADDTDGDTLAANNEAGIYTVQDVDYGGIILSHNFDYDYGVAGGTGVNCTRLRWALRADITSGPVIVRGQGVDTTVVRLASDADCDLLRIHDDGPHGSENGFCIVRDLTLNGRYSEQTAAKRGESNAITVNAFCKDTYLENLFPHKANGHGIVINRPWGTVIDRCVVEWCEWEGVAVYGYVDGSGNDSGAGRITNTKINNNDLDTNGDGRGGALIISRAPKTIVSGCQLSSPQSGWTVEVWGTTYGKISECHFFSTSTGHLRLMDAGTKASRGFTVNGNTFNLAAGTTGIYDKGNYNSHTGNEFNGADSTDVAVNLQGNINNVTGGSVYNVATGVDVNDYECSVVGVRFDGGSVGVNVSASRAHVASCVFAGLTTGVAVDAGGNNASIVANRFEICADGVTIAANGNKCGVDANFYRGCTTDYTDDGTGTVLGANHNLD
ncbi:MAG: hypothetical protein R6X20_02380 [Phycisphaerae bacterium]